ncbi:hypothetical protein [Nesterenkonia pannonica]|uniref:hypothetical protein n=1 Tax=Nesterenkonia pannonica TaxID=1548602 RepID=UPI00216429C5|nr:hypothetical protein [Nesterenkonia pannonica]
MSEETVETFVNSQADDLTRVVRLLVAVLRTSLPEEQSLRRREILKHHPGLRSRIGQLLTEVEQAVGSVLRERSGPGSGDHLAPTAGDSGTLQTLLMLSGAITKHAFSRHHEDEAQPLETCLEDSIALFRRWSTRRDDISHRTRCLDSGERG